MTEMREGMKTEMQERMRYLFKPPQHEMVRWKEQLSAVMGADVGGGRNETEIRLNPYSDTSLRRTTRT